MTLNFDFFKETETRANEKLDPSLELYSRQERGMTFIQHPLVYSVPHSPMMNWMVNDQLHAKQAAIEQAVKDKNLHKYVFLHERPYRLEALKKLEYLDLKKGDKAWWELVAEVWVDSENVHQNWAAWKKIWLKEAKSTPASMYATDADDRILLQAMPQDLEVWHGEEHPKRIGMSWTLDKDVAIWFAKRFDRAGHVYHGWLKKEDVIAYFTGRREEEILCDPKKVLLIHD